MSSDQLISIRVVRGMFLRGEPFAAGTVVAVEPVEAAECVASRRCEYVFPGDRETAIAAARAADDKACAFSGVRPPAWVRKW